MGGDEMKSIIDSISAKLEKVSTQALDLSFNELLDMYESDELNITPDYQRLFRWTEGQRSRLVESLLLEMPVPPIFVIEGEDGTYQLIDGLQRISSYLHLRGKLSAAHLDPPVEEGQMLVLSDCDIIPELNGKSFADFPPSLQIRLKRAFIRVEVVRKGADPHFKYHMFKRLNTGGDELSEQQLRNCTIRMLSSAFPDFLIRMADNDSFRSCTPALTQERRLSAFAEELVLRFFALKNQRGAFKHDVSDFLTEYMEEVADVSRATFFDFSVEEQVFSKTFAALQLALDEYAFSFPRNGRLSSGFSIYHFEALTIGIQGALDKIDVDNPAHIRQLKNVLTSIKLDKEFIKITSGGGKNSSGLLSSRIAFVEERMNNAFA